jgi:type VI secretion system secreted protein Hcp
MVDMPGMPTDPMTAEREIIAMDVSGVMGELQLPGYVGQVSVKKYMHEVVLPLTSDRMRGGATTGKSIHGNVVVQKVVDLSSPLWLGFVSKGVPIDSIVFHFIRNSQGKMLEYRRIALEKIFVARVKQLGQYDGTTDLPMEELHLAYQTIKDTYSQQKPDGSMAGSTDFGWDAIFSQEA